VSRAAGGNRRSDKIQAVTEADDLLDRDAGALLDLFARPAATPAAGSAAALTGALAAALAVKVARLTAGGSQGDCRAAEIADAAERLRAFLQAEAEDDRRVFDEVMRRRAARDAAAEADREALREQAVAALQAAAEGPVRTAGAALEVAGLAVELLDGGRRSARGDAGTALQLALAAAESALLLVAENLRAGAGAAWSREVEIAAQRLQSTLDDLRAAGGRRLAPPLEAQPETQRTESEAP
jgi:formiminotetrahydrofolate cyclodeaminase